MTLAQLLPQAKFLIVTTPQPVAQKVARRSAEMADKLKLEIAGVIENMSGFVTPSGERFPIFGEGGGQLLAEELEHLVVAIGAQEIGSWGCVAGHAIALDVLVERHGVARRRDAAAGVVGTFDDAILRACGFVWT